MLLILLLLLVSPPTRPALQLVRGPRLAPALQLVPGPRSAPARDVLSMLEHGKEVKPYNIADIQRKQRNIVKTVKKKR